MVIVFVEYPSFLIVILFSVNFYSKVIAFVDEMTFVYDEFRANIIVILQSFNDFKR